MSDPSRRSQKPGDAPTLLDRTPVAIRSFLTRLDFFFKLSEVKNHKEVEDELRIMYAGNGLDEEEPAAWYEGAQEELTAMSWQDFQEAFLRRALPPGYLWDALARVRSNHEGGRAYVDWSTEMRQAQLEMGVAALSDLDLIRKMLFNTDSELRRELQQADVLKGSGYHEEEMAIVSTGRIVKARTPVITVPLPAGTEAPINPPVPAPHINFLMFDRTASAKWDLISSRRADAVASALGAARKYLAPKPTSAAALTATRAARTPSSTPSSVPSSSTPRREGRIPALTNLERQCLDANDGCFKCRRPKVFHKSRTCDNEWAQVPFVVPAGWDKATNTVITPVVAGLRAINLEACAKQNSGYLTEDEALTSDSEEEECVELHFPPLSIELVGTNRSIQTLALADTGASSPFLSGRIVDALGMEQRRWKVPRKAKLAIKGRDESELVISHYVLVPLVSQTVCGTRDSRTLKSLTWRSRTARFSAPPSSPSTALKSTSTLPRSCIGPSPPPTSSSTFLPPAPTLLPLRKRRRPCRHGRFGGAREPNGRGHKRRFSRGSRNWRRRWLGRRRIGRRRKSRRSDWSSWR